MSQILENFPAAGFNKESLIDAVLVVIDTTFTNYVNNITQIPVDFPVVDELSIETTP